MVLLQTIEEWRTQSALLLQARPTTARITTKYNIPNLDAPKYQKQKKRKIAETEDKDGTAAQRVPRAVLTLKTYDPESGVCLKLKTDKAVDVGRLVSGLGRLGKHMAALPEDTVMEDAPETANAATEASAPADTGAAAPDTKPQQVAEGGGGGGKKKKKKGKK